MHFYRPRLTSLSESEVLRYAGQKRDNQMSAGDVTAACREALLLSQPQCSWQFFEYDEISHRIFSDNTYLDLCSESLRKHLLGCNRVVALAVTIGDLLETEVESLFSRGDYNSALLLDAAGSAAVETAADHAEMSIASQIAKSGANMIRRFSPGYGDWDLSVQPEFLALTGGHELGIAVTSSLMLTPRKSITAIVGITSEWLRNPFREIISKEIPCHLENCLARKGDT